VTSPLLALPAAVPAPEGSPDVGVAWHHGDPLREQRAAERDVVVVDRSHRGVLAVPGEDRLSWLHTITSQHLLTLGPGAHTEALVLDLHGRVEHHAVVSHVDETVWLDTEPARIPGLLAYLQQMVFWSKVAPRDATDELAVLSLLGPSTKQLLEAAQLLEAVGEVGGFVRTYEDRADLLVPRGELTAAWQRLIDAGASAAGTWAYEALRAAALRPRLGMDTDERTIPHEVGWIGPAVHLESPETLPETGDVVRAGGDRVIGRVGTVAIHHELGPIALALLKRSVEPETPLLAGLAAASIDPTSVPPDTGEPPGRAALRRLRA